MEAGSSLSCSKEPATGPYHKPDEFTPQPSSNFLRSFTVTQKTPKIKKNKNKKKLISHGGQHPCS
jgi:hypothetical protein